jgi:hypothetical protein
VLERVRPAISHDDHACLEGAVAALIELSKLVRERGTTIARLRRLFGLSGSEKTADVLDREATQTGAESATGESSEAAPPGPEASDTTAAEAEESDDGDGAPKKKGHGRIPASKYPNARRTRVAHQSLHCSGAHPMP